MRVCQPCPVALIASNTSASKRMVVETFFTAALGRPRLIASRKTAFSSFGETTLSPIFHSPCSKNSSESSEASSGSIHCGLEAGNFSLIGIPHRNNAATFTACSPYKYNLSAMQYPECDKPLLAIATPSGLALSRSVQRTPPGHPQSRDHAPQGSCHASLGHRRSSWKLL